MSGTVSAMATGDLHEIAPNLIAIEGHHPHAMWEDPDLPTIAVYRGARTLYLLDTNLPERVDSQRFAVGDGYDVTDRCLLLFALVQDTEK